MCKTLSVLFILVLAGCAGGYHHQKATDDQSRQQTCQNADANADSTCGHSIVPSMY
ncbi:hypothetical protein [Hafnia alvei]|uniref:Lipoprotein n=1 Tax=Hafnia alvei TaxID=569 RepID=A0A1C6Z7Q3_HAFAL|nr:hypothetical protein BN1044_04452 [Hafnia alvei]